MLKTALMLPALVVLVAVAVVAVNVGSGHTPAAAEAVAVNIGIDMDVTGNGARTVGSIEDCGEIAGVGSLEIDIVLPDPGIDVSDGISGFQFNLTYDPAVVNITGANLGMLLDQASGSFLIPLGDTTPDSDGDLLVAATDFGPVEIEPAGASETGPGVLVRITLTGAGPGTSLLNLENIIIPNNANEALSISGVSSATVSVDEACEVVEAPSTLTVIQEVINNQGGEEELDVFFVSIDADVITGPPSCQGGIIVESGIPISLDGPHTVCAGGSPLDRGEYTATIGGDCDAEGNVDLELLGDAKTCTVTYDDQGPTLTVQKVVINDNDGTATADDFTLRLDGVVVATGVPIELPTGDYVVSEDPVSGYTATFSPDCPEGKVNLIINENKTCTITNDDIAPAPTLKITPTPTPTPAVAAAESLPSSGFGEVGDGGGRILGPVLIALGITIAIAAVGYTAYASRRRRVS